MSGGSRAIAHLNIIGFRASVAALEDKTLLGRPYVIAGGSGGRVVAWDVSPEALKQHIKPGMALAAAERMVKDLTVIPPNPTAYQKANSVLESLIARYAPAWQNDGCGNLFLDITGTKSLFGPPADCVCKVQNEIIDSLGIKAAAATATNKLVSKVASRAIRPIGLIEVRPGDEASFLTHQDISLLPGLGPSLMKTIRTTGFRESGELAALSEGEAIALFGGKKGILLRDAARGIDNAPVTNGNTDRIIERQADFSEDVLDEAIIRGAMASLAEHGGLEMRRDKLGAASLGLRVKYSDGVEATGNEKERKLLILDNEIISAAHRLYKKTVSRRIRIRSISLSLEHLSPLSFQPDLFEPENSKKDWRFQDTIDSIQNRFGAGSIMRGDVLAAVTANSGNQLLHGPLLNYGH
ncbi:DNA polymerase [Treponema sp. OttesenSCG-928-L16]|nr:DNA polymerase [Treponema sp. OttesenSCG-928-L16]